LNILKNLYRVQVIPRTFDRIYMGGGSVHFIVVFKS
jgi:hypothetical protein